MRSLLALFAVLFALAAHVSADAGAGGEKFDAVGILSTGVFTIGGETTGVTLKTDHGTYELSLFGELARKAEAFEGKRVHVTGALRVLPGIEVQTRSIVAVTTLVLADQPNLMPIYRLSIDPGQQTNDQ